MKSLLIIFLLALPISSFAQANAVIKPKPTVTTPTQSGNGCSKGTRSGGFNGYYVGSQPTINITTTSNWLEKVIKYENERIRHKKARTADKKSINATL